MVWWPNIFNDFKKFVVSCEVCQRYKGKSEKDRGPGKVEVKGVFERWGIDIVGPMEQTSKGNKYIIVATEYLSRWPVAMAVPDTSAQVVGDFLYEKIIVDFGLPKEILSDRGPEFRSKLLETLLMKLKINHSLSSPYHPQTNGLVERFNRTLSEALAKLAFEEKEDWDMFISSILFVYRTKIHTTLGHSPFEILYMVPPRGVNNLEIDGEKLENDLRMKILGKLNDKAFVDTNFWKPELGELVLARTYDFQNKRGSKLGARWEGPYKVSRIGSKGGCELSTLDGRILGPRNLKAIRPYRKRTFEQVRENVMVAGNQ
jgi:hypothetical protein